MEVFFFFNFSLKEELEKIILEYKIFFKEFEVLMVEKDVLSEEI